MTMIDQFINFVIRPPRASYDPEQYLWERNFTLGGRAYKRLDLELTNGRGHRLMCSHYVPSPYPDTPLPCVVYCHGNSGCRADANEAAMILLPSNITVFTLDFSGSGLSDGAYVSLGWHEKDDLGVVLCYLRKNEKVSRVGLWGRSMGAVTCLLYGSEDPSISGIVSDSAFSNLFDLMMELVDVYKIRLPKFTVKMALQYMRRVIQKKAKFDIMDLNSVQVAPKIFIPVLFGHASNDKFIQPHHSDLIFKLYSGDKQIIKFDGDHNSSRPQLFYDSVYKFFKGALCPPQVSSTCSNKLPICTNLESQITGTSVDEDNTSIGVNEECCSYTSSARESWGRCSSLGGSDSVDDIVANKLQQVSAGLAGSSKKGFVELPAKKSKKIKRMKKLITPKKKLKYDGFDKLEALSQRLRLLVLRRPKHEKQQS